MIGVARAPINRRTDYTAHWMGCAVCRLKDYRAQHMKRWMSWDGQDVSVHVWQQVKDWHERIAFEMWAEYLTVTGSGNEPEHFWCPSISMARLRTVQETGQTFLASSTDARREQLLESCLVALADRG